MLIKNEFVFSYVDKFKLLDKTIENKEQTPILKGNVRPALL